MSTLGFFPQIADSGLIGQKKVMVGWAEKGLKGCSNMGAKWGVWATTGVKGRKSENIWVRPIVE